MIEYRTDIRPDAAVVAQVLAAAPLNRPLDDIERIGRMYAASNIVITAWEGKRLVGILRGWTDGAFDGYICDLAVLPEAQRQGIGRKLLDLAITGKPDVQFILRASQIARDYYDHLGWQKIENGWFVARQR
jgi:ribosomal protein S18 acetylase RimI-like enzyme